MIVRPSASAFWGVGGGVHLRFLSDGKAGDGAVEPKGCQHESLVWFRVHFFHLHKGSILLGVPSISILSRDPSLFRKPKTQGKQRSGVLKDRWLKRMGNQPFGYCLMSWVYRKWHSYIRYTRLVGVVWFGWVVGWFTIRRDKFADKANTALQAWYVTIQTSKPMPGNYWKCP